MTALPTVLLVDDDPVFTLAMNGYFESIGWRTVQAPSLPEAERELEKSSPELIFVDIHLAGQVDGIEWIRERRKTGLASKVLFVSAAVRRDDVRRAVGLSDGMLAKPVSIAELCRKLLQIKALPVSEKHESEALVPGQAELLIDARLRMDGDRFQVRSKVFWPDGTRSDRIEVTTAGNLAFKVEKARSNGFDRAADDQFVSYFQPNGWDETGGLPPVAGSGKFEHLAVLHQRVSHFTATERAITFRSPVLLPLGDIVQIASPTARWEARVEAVDGGSGNGPDTYLIHCQTIKKMK